MFESLLETLASWIISIISSTGYAGIFILMAIESALIPLPSEITMPFAGSLVSSGRFGLIWVVLAGTLGNLGGSLLAYALGFWGQERIVRQVIRKYGKYILISEHEFDRAEKWFRKYGEAIVFSSRLMPVVRTFISLPAGIAKMNLTKFIIYTTMGSFLWSFLLTWIGMKLGENWKTLEVYFQKFDIFIVSFLGLGVFFYFIHKYRQIKKPQ